MLTPDHFIRRLPVLFCLARLAGIPRTRIKEFRDALKSPGSLSVLLLLITLRIRRGLGKSATRLRHRTRAAPVETKREPAFHENGEDALAWPHTENADCNGQRLKLPSVATDDSFPQLIFQTWKDKDAVPDNYAYWSATLKNKNPEFAYFLWDDRDNRCFIANYFPWFLPIYDRYPREIYRVDAVRYFFLYKFGGLYADMDTECLMPLAPLFDPGDVWLGRMGNNAEFSHSIPNAIMASRPLQEFWLLVIQLLIEKAEAVPDAAGMASHGPEALTGPVLLKYACDLYHSADRATLSDLIAAMATRLPADLQPRTGPSRVIILGPRQWYPIDWSNVLHYHLASEVVDFNITLSDRTTRRLFPESYTVTYWTHSWKTATATK